MHIEEVKFFYTPNDIVDRGIWMVHQYIFRAVYRTERYENSMSD